MDNSENRVTEAELRRLGRKACKNLSKLVDAAPRTIILESDAPEDASAAMTADIRAILFKQE